MPVPIIAAGIAGAASIGSGIMGHAAQMSAQERADLIREKGVQEWLKINLPDPEMQRLALEKFVSAGELIPELEAPVQALDSELTKIQGDPRLKESRMRALGALEEQGYGGETIGDSAARQKAMIESGAANRGRQEAIVGDLARRGQLGGGLELAARMDAQQSEGDRLAKESMDLEAQRRSRALSAIMGAGELSGDIDNTEFQRQAEAAKARDAINMFNAQNLQAVRGQNVNRANLAQERNLTNRQNIANQNTGLSNFEQQYNKELAQQQFQNESAKAAGLSGQYASQAQGAIDAGKSAAQMWGNVASGIGTTGAGVMKYFDDEKRDKK